MQSEREEKRLSELLAARHPLILISTNEEEAALELVEDAVGSRSESLWLWSAVRGVHAGLIESGRSVRDTEHAAAALYHFAREYDEPVVCVMFDLLGHLEDARTLRSLRELIRAFHERGSTLILVDHRDDPPDVIGAYATRYQLPLPGEDELEQIIRSTVKRVHQTQRVSVRLKKAQLQAIVRNLRGLSERQAERIIRDVVLEDRRLDAGDIGGVLARKRTQLSHHGVLEYVEAPVSLAEVGGLARFKDWLRRREHVESQRGRRMRLPSPRGVLLLGVQGAGKSLCAKAVATAWQRPLLRLDPGTLYDRFVGASEAHLRRALEQAEMMAPIVLWIDEIEKGFASAASHSIDGGLSQRMFGTLLTWMQDHREPVFLVATANNIDALPPELLRKGRFDEIFFVDLPTPEVREIIFTIHLRKRGLKPDEFDLQALADASTGFSGAEIEQAILSACYRAVTDDSDLSTESIVDVLRDSPPLSVTMSERIEWLREWARDRCVPAE